MSRISNYALQYDNVQSDYAEIVTSSADLFITEGDPGDSPLITRALTPAQLAELKGQGRMVVGYVDICVTDALRPYWHDEWTDPGPYPRSNDDLNPVSLTLAPDWLKNRPANGFGVLVKFWDADWQSIVIGQVLQLQALGYSGVFLDDVAAYDDSFTEAQRDTPEGRAAIGQNALLMMKLVAAVREAVGPGFLIVVNADPYMTTYLQFIPPSAEVTQAKADYFAAVDAYLLENPTSNDVTAAGVNLPPGAQLLILQSLDPPRMPEAEAVARGVLYVADNESYNSLGRSPYPATGGADILTGGDGPNQIDALGGNDRIDGLGGADTLTGGPGDDRLDGGLGNDILRLHGGGADTALGGDGDDSLFFGATLDAGDVVDGGAGVDTLVLQGNYAGGLTLGAAVAAIENISLLAGSNTSLGEPGTNRFDYVLTTNDANFAAGVQARINGSALLAGEDFTFNGSAETNASFVVYGGKGKDTLTGGLGNDIFFYAEERFASGDTVNGGYGYDGMFLRGNYTIDFNAPGYTGLFTNIENLTLTSATDERYARGGGTEFDYDLILSNAIVKPGETLTVSGALLMATETMILDASQETDGLLRLFGGKANDTLKGGGQADLIHGNLGADTLRGNGGADTFRYDSTAESNSGARDSILDFTPGTDKIDLSRIDARSDLAGDQAFAWIGSAAFSGVAGQLRAFQQSGSWIVEGDTNGDGIADLAIALTLQGATPLGAGDFLL
jgi:endo-alpha-1,4-polygalactosaminidase (GH114 family)/Ca2+-binding RTX toxin-like protein